MGQEHTGIRLYTSQAEAVTSALSRDGVCFSKREYVVKKYVESAKIFTAAYDWFVAEMGRRVPKPDGAEYPYWAFTELYNLEQSDDSSVLALHVPPGEVVLFDMQDWYKVLRLQYIGENDADERAFRETLRAVGVRQEIDVVLTSFYPDLRRRVLDSWKRMFRHHEAILAGTSEVKAVQAGLWQLRQDWLV